MKLAFLLFISSSPSMQLTQCSFLDDKLNRNIYLLWPLYINVQCPHSLLTFLSTGHFNSVMLCMKFI